jgi:rhamnose transport system permease protein
MRAVIQGWLARWETVLAACVIALLIVASSTTPGFTDGFNVANSISIMSEKSLMILPLTLLIIGREIDISVASIGGLSAVCAGIMLRDGHSVVIAVGVAVAVGLCCGALNGFCVTLLGLPSLVVTLGTLALFRGLCYVLLGGTPVTVIPTSLIDFGNSNISGTHVPMDIVPFLVLAPLFAITLHRLPTGRRIYAIGGNPDTARYSGVNQEKIKFGLFVVSGLACSIAGVINIGRTSQASPDGLFGYELDAITIVFLGGVSFLGGRGRMSGVVWALLLLIELRSALQLHNVSAYAQGTAVGVLLIFSLLTSNLAREAANRLGTRKRRHAAHTHADPTLAPAGAAADTEIHRLP